LQNAIELARRGFVEREDDDVAEVHFRLPTRKPATSGWVR